jgi:hypothetical protein
MARLHPAPIVASVLVSELFLTLVGSEITWQEYRRVAIYSGALGLVLRSVGAPWSPPWHGVLWNFNGVSTTVGLLAFLLLLGAATMLLARSVNAAKPANAVGALFVGIWGSSVLALSLAQTFRLLVDGGEPARDYPGTSLYYALNFGTGSVYHAVLFGWISAAVGAVVSLASRDRVG